MQLAMRQKRENYSFEVSNNLLSRVMRHIELNARINPVFGKESTYCQDGEV